MELPCSLQVRQFHSIHEIDTSEWDSICSTDDVFHKWSFIRVVEDAKVEAADFRYFMMYDGPKLAATAVLSAFSISLDLFIGDSAFVRRLKKLFPGVFNVRMLVCGLPASFGQSNLKVASEKYLPD